ncbi:MULTISPECIES: flagellar biosynthetic protein FliO [Atlantibacter]|uniref:Flagellar protein n=1 Tax=Atlantibacter hermannii NBRC 105704 TaxID=1115512 RepID=H5V0W8_ATLHE|nr:MULTISPECIES: flagellar biosynthetic protein FliO [Atlantibacter]MDU7812782.1 flagellar biosynthetic protein FliO [Atlantibacter hermannii]QPS93148.1 flagellar type III secretion system protein FliO [Atlantibacter hermannii]VDZ74132.1 Flagellar protein fliO [Atlantibacter hermannii]GAB51626.1 flagellar biosynthesis protein FliO [Atlantibacter hermannii NBRC 105704]HCC12506.1 flagellar type III secretion system protein FliO [Atlantibacter hermannii]
MNTQTTTVAAPQPMPQAGSSLMQVSGALAAIILLILLAGWLAKRIGFSTKGGINKDVKVRSSVSLGARERIVVVEVEDARLVLGVTASQITHLHTLPPAPTEPAATPVPPGAEFQNLMKNLLSRNGKR